MEENDVCRPNRVVRALLIACLALLILAVLALLLTIEDVSRRKYEPAALQVLKPLRNAEETYRVRHKSYARLDALLSDGFSPVGEGKVESTTGYTFSSAVKGNYYTIIATPPKADMITYTLVETGEVTP